MKFFKGLNKFIKWENKCAELSFIRVQIKCGKLLDRIILGNKDKCFMCWPHECSMAESVWTNLREKKVGESTQRMFLVIAYVLTCEKGVGIIQRRVN